MKLMRIATLLAGVIAVGACDESGTDAVLAPIPPLAYTRFINAVADTGATDWRFIDQIEYSPVMMGMAFRSFSPYQGTTPGARRLRVFPTSTNISVTSNHIIEATVNLEAGKYYSIIHTGYADAARTPADQIVVMEDVIPTSVPATNIATRIVNLGTGLGSIDTYAVATATTAISGAPMFSAVAYGAGSAYDATRATGSMAFRVTDAGTTTIRASALAPAGSAADATNGLTAIAGYSIGGSVFTGYYFPRSVAGTSAPQTTVFQSPAVVYLYDRHPR